MPPSSAESLKSTPGDFLTTTCCWCASVYSTDLRGLSEHQRASIRIFYRQDNGEIYLDERVCAADTWFHASRVVESWQRGELQKELEREEAKRQQSYQWRRQAEQRKKSRRALAQAELKEKAYKFLRKMAERERDLYGPHHHDLPARIDALAHLQPSAIGYAPAPHSYIKMGVEEIATRTAVYKLSVMMVCEPVIWGKALPETEKILIEAQAAIKKFEDERDQKAREKEEAEREAAVEREAARLARSMPAPVHRPTPSAAVSEFWRSEDETPGGSPSVLIDIPPTPDDDSLLRQMMGEAAYKVVMEARKLSTTDEQGRKRIEILHIPPE
jgi:hypothetical protein